jgi:predicted PurR-regulated permease PerM
MDILLILLAVFGLSFFVAYIYTAKQLKTTTQHLAESVLLYLATVDQSNQIQSAPAENQKAHNESFIKFLSDSRDWAFGYIEEVQNSLKNFIDEVEPQIEHYNKYGIVIEGMSPPHDFALKKISKELDNLKKLLPEDIDDRR